MNFKRKKFLDLMTRIETGEIKRLIIAHKDRLSRFGFDYFEHYATSNGCEIVVAKTLVASLPLRYQQSLSPEQEMIEDLLTIVHSFSSRLYGLRKYKKILSR